MPKKFLADFSKRVRASENAAAFLEPANQTPGHVARPVRLAVELHRAGLAILIRLGGNDGLNALA